MEKKKSTSTVVILVNLGTPDAPSAAAVRRYLAEFLGDRRVIDLPRWWWLPLLHAVILRVRPRRSARLYQRVWTAAGSPLLTGTAALADALQERFNVDADADAVRVCFAMRYGSPNLRGILMQVIAADTDRVIVLPLFPQFSAATSASVFDAIALTLRDLRKLPDIDFIADYHADPGYIEALAQSVEAHWATHGRAELLLLSFHGIPERYAQAGDPYPQRCESSARLLAARLQLAPKEVLLSYQSRVGLETWLQPYTDVTLRELPAKGTRSVQVLCPGFAIDCLETLEEIAMTNRELFIASGGERFEYIPALNAQPVHVTALHDVIAKRLGDGAC